MTIAELIALKKAKIAEMHQITEDNPETMDAETAENFDALEAEVKKIDAQIKRKEKLEAMNEDFQPQGRQTAPTMPAKAKNHEEEARGGFENFADFALAVHAAHPSNGAIVDDRLKFLGAPSDVLHKEGGSNDGLHVPPALKMEVLEVETNDLNMLPLVDAEMTSSNAVQVLRDESTPWGGLGIQAYWGTEAGQMVRSKMETKGETVKLHKVHAFAELTEELLEDAPRLNSRLTTKSNQAINWKLNQGIFEGSGVGKMLGFKESGVAVAVARATANQIDAEALVSMFSRSTNPMGSIWLVNRSVLPKLMTLTVGNQPVYLAPNGLASAPGGTLLGRPVYFSENCEYLGDQGDVKFVDPKGYYMPHKGGIKSSVSAHLLFDYDVQAFKWTLRAGGIPYLSTPVLPNKGTAPQKAANSLSSYIELGDAA
jgi:HK97 family phage major capsid protein